MVSWIAAVAVHSVPRRQAAARLRPRRQAAEAGLAAGALARTSACAWPTAVPAFARRASRPSRRIDGHAHDPYATPFYTRFRAWLTFCVRRRWLVIGVTVAAFVASVVLFRFVPQQFFPDSTRPELMVDIELAEGSSLRATDGAGASGWRRCCAKRKDLDNYVAYVGTGSPRFYLPLDQQLPAANFAQFVLHAQGHRGARGDPRAG